MRIRMRTLATGPKGNFYPGQVIDVNQETADGLLMGGFAESVDVPAEAKAMPEPPYEPDYQETATVEPPERAVLPRSKPQRAKPRYRGR